MTLAARFRELDQAGGLGPRTSMFRSDSATKNLDDCMILASSEGTDRTNTSPRRRTSINSFTVEFGGLMEGWSAEQREGVFKMISSFWMGELFGPSTI